MTPQKIAQTIPMPSNLPDKNRCRVSVVIPCYNHAHYLAEAIQSVLAQTRPADEIIVVDDGSTDNTAQVAATFGQRVTYLFQRNAGLSAARNTGIKNSTGEYLGFLDADDLWYPEFLATLASLLDAHPKWGAVYCGNEFIDAHAHPLSQTVEKTVPPDALRDALIGGQFFPPCAVLVRKTSLDRVGLFDETLFASEDWDLWLRISAQFPFGGTPQTLARYRQHGNNMTRDLARMQANQLHVVRKHFGIEQGDPRDWSAAQQRAFAGVYFWLALAHFQRSENKAGQAFVKRAFVTHPDLVTSIDTFYLLACADQPPGYVGDPETLHFNENAQQLFATLDSIFRDVAIPSRLRANQRDAYGLANFALGLLAYRQRKLAHARNYFLRAAREKPLLIRNAQWRAPFLKTFLGERVIGSLRALKKNGSLSLST